MMVLLLIAYSACFWCSVTRVQANLLVCPMYNIPHSSRLFHRFHFYGFPLQGLPWNVVVFVVSTASCSLFPITHVSSICSWYFNSYPNVWSRSVYLVPFSFLRILWKVLLFVIFVPSLLYEIFGEFILQCSVSFPLCFCHHYSWVLWKGFIIL